ncbi:MAG: HAMP domain-containing protein [Chloroflexi bacterium]|nr:ATP-binding protein [Chloroflexota bacterium]MXZ46029.1 HAMP domain-containing protein [Chloroflexota bacterium]
MTYLRRLLASRRRISTQLYLAFAGAVLLTLAATLVGWFSFNRVGEVQDNVNEGSVPEMAAAFGAARHSGVLVAAAPNLTVAATPEEFAQVSRDIDIAYAAFAEQVEALEGTDSDPARVASIGAHADTLIANIEQLENETAGVFALRSKRELLEAELANVRSELGIALAPAIDNQLFFILTGYSVIAEDPAEREEHFSEAQLVQYRRLSELHGDVNIATELLANAFTLSDPSLIEPLRERFEATITRIERNLPPLEGTAFHYESAAAFERLVELGSGEDSVFDLFASELTIMMRQEELLSQNRDVSLELNGEVTALISAAQASVQDATRGSAQAMQTGLILLLAISALSVASTVMIVLVFVRRVLLRRIGMVSDWMRSMAGGDLETTVDVGGQDEVAEMAAALEVFRRHALEVQRLNLVEQLAEELQGKNDELESVLAQLETAQDQIVMREKLAALGELTAGVAHEIRNPLNFVKNFSEASGDLVEELKEILEEEGVELSEEQRGYVDDITDDLVSNVERIRSHGERADRIVSDMLQMGRGGQELLPTDINALLEEHARLAYHSARGTNQEFQLDIKEEFDPEVGELEVVPQDLGRVFLNMVNNAGYAAHERRMSIGDGTIGIGKFMPTLTLRTKREGDMVEIRIIDNGIGMPPDVIEKIFNPFFTTKPTDQGTGLGLAISADIIRRHGGSIRVESEPGEGTEMIIDLPVERPADVEATPEEVPV